MNMKKDRRMIVVGDKESKNIFDKVDCVVRSEDEGLLKPKGFVSIIDKDSGEYLIKDKPCEFGGTGKDNLIVWNGRQIIPQILFNQDRNNGSNQKDLKIRWLSIGVGGADSVNVLDPITPLPQDISLYSESVINSSNPLYADGGKKKPFDSVAFEQDDENDNRYLIAKITTTILYEEANIKDLSEAALWFSNSTNPLTVNTYELLARVSFSTIRKHENRELIILWYIYF